MGATTWDQTYGGPKGETPSSLVQTLDGGYAMAGFTFYSSLLTPTVTHYDLWLVKTDSSGNMQWNRTYDGGANEEAYSLVQTPDGGYALAGYTSSFGAGDSDFWLVKVDSSGNIQGNQTYGGTGDDVARSLVQTSDGGYAMTGFTVSSDANQRDFWLVKTDEQSVIPEFTSLIIPLLFFAITLFVLILEKHVGYLSAT